MVLSSSMTREKRAARRTLLKLASLVLAPLKEFSAANAWGVRVNESPTIRFDVTDVRPYFCGNVHKKIMGVWNVSEVRIVVLVSAGLCLFAVLSVRRGTLNATERCVVQSEAPVRPYVDGEMVKVEGAGVSGGA